MQKNKNYLSLLILGVFLMIGAFAYDHSNTLSLSEIAAKTSRNVEQRSVVCKQALNLLFEKGPDIAQEELNNYFEEIKTGIYLFRNDSVVFWNNSRFPLKQNPNAFPKQQGFVKLEHGYYIYFKRSENEKTGIALCLVKPVYELQNNYLKNNFSTWTGIPGEIKLETTNQAENPVTLDGEKLFSLKGNETRYYNASAADISLVLFMLGVICLLASILQSVRSSQSLIMTGLWVTVLFCLRFLMVWLKWPVFLYRSTLYDLQLFGNAQSFWNGYLGDILLNAAGLGFIALMLHFQSGFWIRKAGRLFKLALLSALILLVISQFNQTAVSLITNSTLSFDFLSIFNIRLPAFVGLTALALHALSLFILVHRSVSFFSGKGWQDILKFFVMYLAVCGLQQFFSGTTNYPESFWPLLYAVILFALIRFAKARTSLTLGVQILIMSVVTSNFFNVYIAKNQKKDLDILSLKLGERQDAVLENEFSGIPEKIRADESLNNLIVFLQDIPTAEEETKLLLKQKYFGGYFDRYNVDFSLFDKDCHPLLQVKQPVMLNQGYFEDQIIYNSDSTFVPGLFFVKKFRKNSQYIGKINLKDKNLYVLMEPKQFEELGSFPDLLLDQSQQKPEKLKNFSHAVYRFRQITSRFGDFNYPFFFQDSSTLANSDPGFVHHYFRPDEVTDVVISQNARKWNYFFTFNSYLLLFFSLVTYGCYLLHATLLANHFISPSLTRRIQTIIIILLLLAMSAVGITSGSLVTRQFERDNKKQLEEKTRIIINELTGQFKPQQFFDAAQKELINLKLKEYARLFSTPISLFNKNGYLFNTSESKLYDLGLAAPLVNPKAFRNLAQNLSSSESVNEKAGTLKYKSLYTPLFDEKKELIGFINLPYFARQSDLVNELSGIISALINVYVILFVISIISGLILSGFITQPLRLIKQQLANITLGKHNEKIVWQSNDEIGKLVSEYNQMLVKLEESANLLAQSERESAWREMAKQVAHEIKNPLTPMKLNLQYLQHLMKNDTNDFRDKFEKASAGIIEQIDSLANIANEFSHFAKLPGIKLQTINLSEVVDTSVLIFENQKNIRIINDVSGKEIFIKGDRDQCVRVFNNILNNAVQALDDVMDPQVEINYELKESSVIVSIHDNGCGIDENLKSKIFTPNFTTKTTGSGLGLPMVKNIMQGFGGRIWFTSEKNTGTTFYLEFILAETL